VLKMLMQSKLAEFDAGLMRGLLYLSTSSLLT
jgi:hypothetical protein